MAEWWPTGRRCVIARFKRSSIGIRDPEYPLHPFAADAGKRRVAYFMRRR